MRHRIALSAALIAAVLVVSVAAAPAAADLVDLLSYQQGTMPVVEPSTYGGWPALHMIDDFPESGWAAESGHTKDNVFVFELIGAAGTFERFEFDTAQVDGDGRGARHVVVEVSPTSKSTGFVEVARGELADRGNGQKLVASKRVAGRWVRLSTERGHVLSRPPMGLLG